MNGYKSFLVYPYIMLIPVAIFSLLMLCFNLFGDGLRDALDPTMKESDNRWLIEKEF